MIKGLKDIHIPCLNVILFLTQLLFIFALKLLAEGIGAYVNNIGKPIPRLAECMFQSGLGIYSLFACLLSLLFIVTTYISMRSNVTNLYLSLSTSLIRFLQSVFILAISLLFWSIGLSK